MEPSDSLLSGVGSSSMGACVSNGIGGGEGFVGPLCSCSGGVGFGECAMSDLGKMRALFLFTTINTNFLVCRITTPSLPPCAWWDGMMVTWLPTGKVVGGGGGKAEGSRAWCRVYGSIAGSHLQKR
jgi:hypothetical protein